MDFIDTLPELADLNEQLPYANTLDEAYWLAELASMCHRRLDGKTYPAGFWGLLDVDDAKHLRRFLNDSRDGVSNAANDLQVLVESEPVPFGNCVEETFFMIEKLARDYPDKPEMVAEARAAYAKFLQECNAVLEVG